MSKAAEGCKHHKAGRQLGGGALVLGTSFVQRKTPAVTGVVKAGVGVGGWWGGGRGLWGEAEAKRVVRTAKGKAECPNQRTES